MNTDTPDTDAASWVETNQANALTLASFSKKLERQRDELRQMVRELRDVLDDVVNSGLEGPSSQCCENASALITKANQLIP